jgi:hypothetical protein
MQHEHHAEDHQRGNQVETVAVLDVARLIEQPAKRLLEDNEGASDEAGGERSVVAAIEEAHHDRAAEQFRCPRRRR